MRGVERGMMTRRRFSLLAASLPLSLAGSRKSAAQDWAAQQEEQNRRIAEWQKEMRLPLTRVAAEGDRTLYSGAVNSIFRWADAGDATYLGTRLGVKRVSKKPGTAPRHYLRVDGLPLGRVLDLIADEKGAFALLDVAEGTEAVYGLDMKSDRWKELARWPKSRRESGSYSSNSSMYEDGLLALGEDVALATPRVASTRSDAVLVCVGRDDGLIRSLPWDALIRADHPSLRIGHLACGKKTVTLGTDIGLLEVPLSADGGAWTRSLADQEIADGRRGGGRLYLWLEPRNLNVRNGGSRPSGRAHLYDPKSGALQPLPEPALFPQAGFAAAVDGEGALWVVRQRSADGEDPFRFWPRLDSGDAEVLFWRWRPGDSRWARLRPDGAEIKPGSPATMSAPGFFPDFALPAVAAASVVPDAPARLAALNAFVWWGQDSPPFPGQPVGLFHPIRWLKVRFPHWLGADDAAEVPGPLRGSPAAFSPAIGEPGNPARAWLGEEGGSLAAVSPTTLPGPVRPPSGEVGAAGWYNLPRAKGEPLARVPLPATTFALHASVRRLLPLGGGAYLALGERISLVTERGGRWEEIVLPKNASFDGKPMLTPSDSLFFLGKERVAYLSYWLEPNLLRFDPKALAFVPTALPRFNSGQFVGADEEGAWWHVGATELQFLEPGAKEARKRVPGNVPAGFATSYAPKLAAGRLWWQGNLAGKQTLLGWNPRTDIWSASLAIANSSSDLAPVEGGRGGVCVALRASYDARELEIHRWDAKADKWEVLASVPSPRDANATLLAVGGDGVWLTDRKSLLRSDPKKKNLETYALPVENAFVYGDGRELRAEREAFFLMTGAGLWRFDRQKRVWAEWTMPVPSTRVQPQVLATDETSIWGAVAAPSSSVSPLFRFTPSTRRFDFYDGRSGLPDGKPGRLVSTGKGVWFLHEKGAFRFDAGTQRFACEAEFRASHLAAASDGSHVWIAGSPAKYGDPTLCRWSRETGKVLPEPSSKGSYCYALLSSGQAALVASAQGLFRTSEIGVWESVETWGLTPTALRREPDGSVWVTAGDAGFLRLDARAGL